MGAGKSVVGSELAKLFCVHFVDLDREVEKKTGRSISAIFSEDGEEAFRAMESKVVADIAGQSNIVAALGGGTFIAEENRRQLMKSGKVIYLKVPFDILFARIRNSSRPLVHEARALFEKREKTYELADITMEADKALPQQLAKRIMERVL